MIKLIQKQLFLSERLSLVAVFIFVLVPSSFGQGSVPGNARLQTTGATTLLSFDVASVKPNKAGGGWRSGFTPDGYSALNVTPRMLISDAYGIYEPYRISKGPAWLDSERFDIEARVESNEIIAFRGLDQDHRMIMLQKLLAERFKLTAHKAEKEMPVYALKMAKAGTRLVQSNAYDTDRPGGHVKLSKRGHLVVEWFSMADLAKYLSTSLGRLVVDETGLKGRYDFELNWTPDEAALPPGSAFPSNDSAPSIFTATEEQLGLKLEATRGLVDSLVIDNIVRPSEN